MIQTERIFSKQNSSMRSLFCQLNSGSASVCVLCATVHTQTHMSPVTSQEANISRRKVL